MILVFGGAYQGKLEYALKTFGLEEADVYHCSRQGGLDFNKKVIYGLEAFVYWCTSHGIEAREVLAAQEGLSEKVFIACDVSQGLVPMDATDRAFREMMGRTLLFLAKEADEVHRVFCGLGQRLK